jgi:hypothetical protein
VQWSYELLAEDERTLLNRCCVFADGFDLAAATHVCSDESVDEYAVLDGLDSLVRKSLMTAEVTQGKTRYALLETIRQFAEEQLAEASIVVDVRSRHASFFAQQAIDWCRIWDGPRQREALEWVEAEFANLRSACEWGTDSGKLDVAADIAAHSVILAFPLQIFEPTKWCEDLIPMARERELPELGRLYGAAVLCGYAGRRIEAVEYGRAAVVLQEDDRYESFGPSWNEFWTSVAVVVAGGDPSSNLEMFEAIVSRPGPERVMGLFGMFYLLPACGRADEAVEIATEAEAAAKAYGNPFWIAWLHAGYRAFSETDPDQARRGLQKGLAYARDQRLPFVENRILQELAWLEVLHGTPGQALDLFDHVLDELDRAGNHTDLRATLCYVSMLFERMQRAELAATVFGTSQMSAESWVVGMPSALGRLRDGLGVERFDACVAAGDAMELTAAVHFAREGIRGMQVPLAGAGEKPA